MVRAGEAGAFRLLEVDRSDAVFDHATEAATEVLDFDDCGFFVHDDGTLRPASLETVPPRQPTPTGPPTTNPPAPIHAYQ